jgi:tetratricopeptide (TPR) repeat protein
MLKKSALALMTVVLCLVPLKTQAAPSQAELEKLANDPWALYLAAQQEFSEQDFDNAISLLKGARQNSPSESFSKMVRLNLLGIYKAAGNISVEGFPKRAVQYFSGAVGIKPDDFYSFQRMGDAYCELGQFQACIQSHSRSITLRPDNDKGNGYWFRGAAYSIYMKDEESARADYERAIKAHLAEGRPDRAEVKAKLLKAMQFSQGN